MSSELHIIEKLKILPFFPMAVTHIEHIHTKALFLQPYIVHTQVNFELVHSFQLLRLVGKNQRGNVCVSVPHVTVSSCKVDAVVQR